MKKSASVLITRWEYMVGPVFLGVTRKHDHNDWGLPGGKADEGESFEECAVRECFEETGVTVNSLGPELFTGPVLGTTDYECRTFLVTDWSGTLRDEDGALTSWITGEKLLAGSFGDYNRIVLSVLFSKSIFNKYVFPIYSGC